MIYDRSNTVQRCSVVLPFSIQPGRVVTLVEAQEVSNHTRISVVGNSRKFIVATSGLHHPLCPVDLIMSSQITVFVDGSCMLCVLCRR